MNKITRKKAEQHLKIPVPVAEFKIRAGRNYFQWTVKIFATLNQMRRYLRFTHEAPRRFALTWSFTDNQRYEMIFALPTCTDNCVAHECWHAIAWDVQTRAESSAELATRLIWDHQEHERAAEALGCLVSVFWEKFTAAGLPRKECWGWEPAKRIR